jgi:hypothetical protein
VLAVESPSTIRSPKLDSPSSPDVGSGAPALAFGLHGPEWKRP